MYKLLFIINHKFKYAFDIVRQVGGKIPMTTKGYQEELPIEELQAYKTYTAKKVAILVGIYVLLSLIPIFDQIEMPLRFTLTDLITAVVLIILIEILCDFGEKNEQYQFVTIYSTYQSGTVIKYLLYLLSAIIGYTAYKDIVTPYLGEYHWIYPTVFGLTIISILLLMVQKITQTSEQQDLNEEQEDSSTIIEPTEEQQPEEQEPQKLEETGSDSYLINNLAEQQELPELLEDQVENYNFQGEVTLEYIMEIFQDHEQDHEQEPEQEQEHGHESEAEVEHEAEPEDESEHEPEERKVDVKKQDDITDKEEYSHESETTGIKCKNCGATIKYGTIFCNNCFGS